MEREFAEELERSLQGSRRVVGRVPIYLDGHWGKAGPSEMDAGYWYRKLRQTVRFADAVEQLLADGHRFFVEVSPHPVLSLALQENCATQRIRMSRLWVRCAGTREERSGCCFRWASFYVRGLGCGLERTVAGSQAVPLPTYAFERQRYWLDAAGQRTATCHRRGLCRRSIRCWARASRWRKETTVFLPVVCRWRHMPGLRGHVVFGAVLLPGRALWSLRWQRRQRVGLDTVDELTLEAPLVVPERGALQLQLLVGALEETSGDRFRCMRVRRTTARAAGRGMPAGF